LLVAVSAVVTREQPRPEKVVRFRELLRSGSKPPPIRVMRYPDAADGNDVRRWYLYDGHHRVAAARAEGASHVLAVVVSLA
jgi:hypothetical protein